MLARILCSPEGRRTALIDLDDFAYECKLMLKDSDKPRLSCIRFRDCLVERSLCLSRIVTRVVAFLESPFSKQENLQLLVLTWLDKDKKLYGVSFDKNDLDNVYILKKGSPLNKSALDYMLSVAHEKWEISMGAVQ